MSENADAGFYQAPSPTSDKRPWPATPALRPSSPARKPGCSAGPAEPTPSYSGSSGGAAARLNSDDSATSERLSLFRQDGRLNPSGTLLIMDDEGRGHRGASAPGALVTTRHPPDGQRAGTAATTEASVSQACCCNAWVERVERQNGCPAGSA
jgi:hypothetical protein